MSSRASSIFVKHIRTHWTWIIRLDAMPVRLHTVIGASTKELLGGAGPEIKPQRKQWDVKTRVISNRRAGTASTKQLDLRRPDRSVKRARIKARERQPSAYAS